MADNPYLVDCKPLPAEVNAFQRAADMLVGKYQTQEQLELARKDRAWLLYWAKRKDLPATSREPLILIALARMATDGDERARFLAVCREIDRVVYDGEAPAEAPGQVLELRAEDGS